VNRLLVRLVVAYQRTAVRLSYAFHRAFRRRLPRITWVVGPEEVASMLGQIARAVPGSYSVSFVDETAYDISYDHHFRFVPHRRWLERILLGPVLLGRLMTQATGFIYVGHTGFLVDQLDHRDFEFAFLKRKGLRLVCYWTGSDIRSTRVMHALEEATGRPNISTYIAANGAIFESDLWDDLRRGIAAASDRHADAMFNWFADQRGYLTMPHETFMFYLDEDPDVDLGKFADPDRLVVVHATTSPVIKGTPLVRAAVAQLRREGYDFEYVELIGVSNQQVKAELRRAHIALNQFYGFTPTVFGIEAMLRGTAVMMSAETAAEPDLPDGADEAWLVTPHYAVYANLKLLLDNPDRLEPLARRGLEWARRHATVESAGPRLVTILEAIADGSYRAPAADRFPESR
jgi:hypothetical protein